MKQINNGIKLIYDIEVYPNLFLVAFFNIDNNNYETFVLLNDNTYQDYHSISELVDFIQDDNKTLIGFNNSEYDDLLLKYINENPNSTNQELYEISKSIIEKKFDKNSYYNLKYKTNKSWNKSIDLYKILPNGYGSLKELSIKLHHHKTQDLPYLPDKIISYKEADEIIRYNINDIEITRKIYQLDETKQIITIRSNMEKDYRVDALSSVDSNLGDRIFLKKYCESTNQNEYDVKEQQTDVSMVVLKDDIPDYISFETKELQSLLVELQEMGITVDKKTGKINDKPLKKTVKFHNMNYKFSGGGLHSIDKPEIFESDDEYCIIDADVTSYYS